MEITQLMRCLLLVAVLCCGMISARPRPEKRFDDCAIRWTGVRCQPPVVKKDNKTWKQKLDLANAYCKSSFNFSFFFLIRYISEIAIYTQQ